jgi:hypothetical protein
MRAGACISLLFLLLLAACSTQETTGPGQRAVPAFSGTWLMAIGGDGIGSATGARCSGRGAVVIDTLGDSGDFPATVSLSGLCERVGNRGFSSGFHAGDTIRIPVSGGPIAFNGSSCRFSGAILDVDSTPPHRMGGTGECRGISAGLVIGMSWSAVKQ